MKIICEDSFEEDEMEPESVEEASELIPRNMEGHYEHFLRPLIELYSVHILNFTGNIYGTIRVQDPMLLQDIYIREREDSEPICPADNDLLMTGPDEALSALGDFTIFVDLMDKDRGLPLVTRGLMARTMNKYRYDKPIVSVVKGNYGDGYESCSVRVRYNLLRDAVEAAVKVTLIIRDGEDPSHVFGRITACNPNFAEEKIVLFRKSSKEHIDVRSGQLIPLSRFVVVVPVNSSLIVGADLLNYNAISSDTIAKGTAEFPAKFRGTFEKLICGQCSEIQVKVTFGPEIYGWYNRN
ncbi:hypothetical protein HHK36_019022 [Tetracentron sinense]|uniref:DUF6598 domain-containing protein n=1 Tax=Tetracentron sinense TaxID=13715 RepID=A0A834YVH1_TETSI|nr:hypothetical protein HHK36_019022 [Tetracentron sinense]